MKLLLILLILVPLSCNTPSAAVHILEDSTEIEDATVYGCENCDGDMVGEDCRRYNSGAIGRLRIGLKELCNAQVVMRFPGWDGTIPDSSELRLHCIDESDSQDRRLFAYPLLEDFIEGTESFGSMGDLPDPDSGVTWYHTFLDDGDLDSALWSTPGGTFTTVTSCTALVTDSGQDAIFRHFNRILTWCDSVGTGLGIAIVNENAFPANGSRRDFWSSEGDPDHRPQLLLYQADSLVTARRRIVLRAGGG